MEFLLLVLAVFPLYQIGLAQFPPQPEDLLVVHSKHEPGVSVTYKSPGICETTPGVQGYAGYVHLPKGTIEDTDYDINTFFWFFEARSDPANAPLTIWMNGGPGSPSAIGLLQENGPCLVNPDSNSTRHNQWSWNGQSNMLYVDQPVQTGFSYDSLVNGTLDQTRNAVPAISDFRDGIPAQNATFYVGTFASQIANHTANSTDSAARAFWHFAQAWSSVFPQYMPGDRRINLWTESYGGRYGPVFAKYIQAQNEMIRNGTIDRTRAHEINLDTLGIINGCIDVQIQELSWPLLAYNNTYDITGINETMLRKAINAYALPGGCKDQIQLCRDMADNDQHGNNDAVCKSASDCVNLQVEALYGNYSGRANFDMAHPFLDPFPPPFYVGYLNQPHVQRALGVPLNYTDFSTAVRDGFDATGDYVKGGSLEDIGTLLDAGTKVALVYGDRDYACQWLGGEWASMAVEFAGADKLQAAGYAPLYTNNTHIAGMTRQHGNFSFTRVFESGHEVPAYQPETALKIFARANAGLDIATGRVKASGTNYSTQGRSDTFGIRNPQPPYPRPTCYVQFLKASCNADQIRNIRAGTAVIENYIVVGYTNGTKETLVDLSAGGAGNYSGPGYIGEIEAVPVTESSGRLDPWRLDCGWWYIGMIWRRKIGFVLLCVLSFGAIYRWCNVAKRSRPAIRLS